MLARIFLLGIFGLLAAGCAKKREPAPLLPVRPTITLAQAQALARDPAVSCGGDCLPAVGMLTMAGKFAGELGAAQCTASLVGPDILATNGHCLPDEAARQGANCAAHVWITFPSDPTHPEYDHQIGCSEVIFYRRDGHLQGADYAFLRLQRPSNRPALRVSRAGLAESQPYFLQKTNPVRFGDRLGGRVETVSCRALFDSAVFADGRDARTLTSLLSDCRVVPGNSGGPVLAADGTVRGVVYGYAKKEIIRDQLVRQGLEVPPVQEIADLNLASNFACLTDPWDSTGHSIPTDCSDEHARLERAQHQQKSRRVAVLLPQAAGLIAQYLGEQPAAKAYGWKLDEPTLDLSSAKEETVTIPSCVHDAEAAPWIGRDVEIRRPQMTLLARFDRYLYQNYDLRWSGWAARSDTFQLSFSSGSGYTLTIRPVGWTMLLQRCF